MVLALLGILPAVPHIIMGIESMFKHGNGPAKKQAAMAALGDMVNIFDQSSGGPGADSSTMVLIDDLIEAFVKVFNNNGTFTHSTTGTGATEIK
jgi:hypothetical protein